MTRFSFAEMKSLEQHKILSEIKNRKINVVTCAVTGSLTRKPLPKSASSVKKFCYNEQTPASDMYLLESL